MTSPSLSFPKTREVGRQRKKDPEEQPPNLQGSLGLQNQEISRIWNPLPEDLGQWGAAICPWRVGAPPPFPASHAGVGAEQISPSQDREDPPWVLPQQLQDPQGVGPVIFEGRAGNE